MTTPDVRKVQLPTDGIDRLSRSRGALLGLACGDAIGSSVEFMARGTFPQVVDMVGGGPFHLLPGQFTDDTSMALCLAQSLLVAGFDLHDQIRRYLMWRDHGYMSSNGKCFDIGLTTAAALERFSITGNPLAGSKSPQSAGNGSIMRLSPVLIRYQDCPALALTMAQESSKTTHQARECLGACHLLGQVLLRALKSCSKAEMLEPMEIHAGYSQGLTRIASAQYRRMARDQVMSSGYVVETLEAALWCFWNTSSFPDCVLMAANLGDDSDTTAAVAGQIAGAHYGAEGIPPRWLKKLTMADEIGLLAERLAHLPLSEEGRLNVT